MPSYTTFLTTALAASRFITPSVAGYALEDDYSVSNFFSMFDFFTDEDPTHGFVKYVDQSTAQKSGLISTSDGTVYMGVDATNKVTGGRPSVRITSKKSYNEGLVILDLAHMPGSVCGTWPAFWMVGPDWPSSGEIDIIEGVNDQAANSMALHTSDGCSITNNNLFSGDIHTSNCFVKAQGQADNAGCSIGSDASSTYGDGFNAANGGVYATEWSDDAISIWHFTRANIPSDIESGNPDPTSWGTPLAVFQGGCNIGDFFKNQQIVFDITFCGDWAGNVWSSGSCASKANTCNDFVGNNPTAFTESFWSINSLKVYKAGGAVSSAPSAAPTTSKTPEASSLVIPTSLPFSLPTSLPISVPISIPTSLPGFSTFEISTKSSVELPGLSSSVPVPSASPSSPTTAAASTVGAFPTFSRSRKGGRPTVTQRVTQTHEVTVADVTTSKSAFPTFSLNGTQGVFPAFANGTGACFLTGTASGTASGTIACVTAASGFIRGTGTGTAFFPTSTGAVTRNKLSYTAAWPKASGASKRHADSVAGRHLAHMNRHRRHGTDIH